MAKPKIIWKTVLNAVSDMEVQIPEGAEILCAHEQGNEICIWYKCDEDAPLKPRRISIVGTGFYIPAEARRYLGTAFISAFGRPQSLVFHVFEH